MTTNTAALSNPHSLDGTTPGTNEHTTGERRFYTPEDLLRVERLMKKIGGFD